MKKAITAGLLSAFVAPGSGHFYLKHKRSALVFFSLAVISLMLLLMQIYQVAQVIALEIQNGTLPLDVGVISAEITQQTQTTMANANELLYGFLLCWLVALLDSIRLGLKQDKQDALTTSTTGQ
ncbi:hypothetical protein N7V09_05210 [Shewanella seohaensis]|uniref:hypothetical protein n=1 Tax=Shewanella seohaensis TaxID=755175 RepID=UPI00200F3FD1|nr:hypothetical protein [Shewanella seohaensis]MCL1119849.1 hypothetical protein [Shewanella seohaensis]UXM82961.1 hypothetical protein N7V09_05210 [Shewanella seohaensis]